MRVALLLLALLRWAASVCGEECPEKAACQRLRGHRVVCSGGLHQFATTAAPRVRSVWLCDWPEATLDPAALARAFPGAQQVALLNANVSRLSAPFPPMAKLETLNMTGLGLRELSEDALGNLTSLRTLDLRNNHLERLDPELFDDLDELKQVYLSGNRWDCATADVTWLLGDDGAIVKDRDAMRCGDANFTERPVVRVMYFIKAMQEKCPSNCTCWMGYVAPTKEGFLLPIITVDCSGRGLTQLPEDVPENTTTLILTGNKIRDVSRLSRGLGHYPRVLDVQLDDNEVSSLDELEGSRWLSTFRALSVRGNRLSQLPAYAFDDALEHNGNALRLALGHNPWLCDCHVTPPFQVLLLKYSKLVTDLDDIRCQNIDGDENANVKVKDVSRNSVCRVPEEQLVQPLDVLNGVLAALIAVSLAKLAYDYWAFKRTGKLPWLVGKMP
ncbi:protein singed wings 2 [Schistocerca nitens]|uniref:protein singed wings 2 n=1 Tax=Schistocerca nitens TaxID=7011 RepID=UPI0021175299|nr:protein singed wings 2 [Schistocerca nitens]